MDKGLKKEIAAIIANQRESANNIKRSKLNLCKYLIKKVLKPKQR